MVLAADGQVTLGEGVIKHSAKKTRRLYNDKISRDSQAAPPTRFRSSGASKTSCRNFTATWPRAAVELAKEWRTDRSLRHLDALLVVADAKVRFCFPAMAT